MGCFPSKKGVPAPTTTSTINNPASGFASTLFDEKDLAVSVYHISHILRPACLQALSSSPELAKDADENIIHDATVENIVNVFIKPTTAKSRTSYVHHVLASLPMRDSQHEHVGKAVAMLSYTWGYKFLEVIRTLEDWVLRTGRNAKTTYIWMCALCVNQHNIPANPAATFEERILSIGLLLPLLTPWNEPLYVKRLWCLYELWLASRRDVCQVQILFPEHDVHLVRDELRHGAGGKGRFRGVLDLISCAHAEASVESDRRFIRGEIERTTGFRILDELVQNKLRTLYMELDSEAWISREVATAPCQLYIATDCAERQFQHALKCTYQACQDTFVKEKNAGSRETVNIKAIIGTASSDRVAAAATENVLPCLLWLAVGPNVLTQSQTSHGSQMTCEFIASLKDSETKIDVAIVCMTYGGEWAAQQLIDASIAQTVVYISADAAIIGHQTLHTACVGSVQDLFRMAIFHQLHSDTLADTLQRIWEQRMGGVNMRSCARGVLHAATPTSVLPMLKGVDKGTLAFVPEVPEGNYFQRVFGGAPGMTIAPAEDLDVAHYNCALEVFHRMRQAVTHGTQPSILFVVADWDADDEALQADSTGVGGAEGMRCVNGIVEYACSLSATVGTTAGFVECIEYSDGTPLVPLLHHVPRRGSGVVWMKPAAGITACM
eukprot:m.1336101 g.1336101  ORF g.1336101 m.1336101 type:complete len:666 (-) comp24879_c1_seq57:6148-8145(-)